MMRLAIGLYLAAGMCYAAAAGLAVARGGWGSAVVYGVCSGLFLALAVYFPRRQA